MIIQVLHGPYCQGTDRVRHGQSPEGKQRYHCRECRAGRGRTLLLDDRDARPSPGVKQQSVEMTMNASGIRAHDPFTHPATVAVEPTDLLLLGAPINPHKSIVWEGLIRLF